MKIEDKITNASEKQFALNVNLMIKEAIVSGLRYYKKTGDMSVKVALNGLISEYSVFRKLYGVK